MTEANLQGQTLNIESQGDNILVNGIPLDSDIQALNPGLWHLLHKHQSFHVFVQKIDQEEKVITLSVNGKKTEVKLVSRMEKLLKELGMAGQMTKKLDTLKAPMPGLIHTVYVKPGDEVTKGQPLLILEAMKMENVIKSPGDATVKEVVARKGVGVEKNALLIRFE